jgi:hypothetical protein
MRIFTNCKTYSLLIEIFFFIFFYFLHFDIYLIFVSLSWHAPSIISIFFEACQFNVDVHEINVKMKRNNFLINYKYFIFSNNFLMLVSVVFTLQC